MCKAAGEPGGPRRCATEARLQYQRSLKGVTDLERKYDRLTEQLAALAARRDSVARDIDVQGAELFAQLTGHRPVTIATALGEDVTVSYAVADPPAVSLRWSGGPAASAWVQGADLDAPIADALAAAFDRRKWQSNEYYIERITLPHSHKQVILAASRKVNDGVEIIVVDQRAETDPYGGSTKALHLEEDAVRQLAVELAEASQQLLDLRGREGFRSCPGSGGNPSST